MNYQRWMQEWNEIIERVSELTDTLSVLETDMLNLQGVFGEESERRYNEALECDAQREDAIPTSAGSGCKCKEATSIQNVLDETKDAYDWVKIAEEGVPVSMTQDVIEIKVQCDARTGARIQKYLSELANEIEEN